MRQLLSIMVVLFLIAGCELITPPDDEQEVQPKYPGHGDGVLGKGDGMTYDIITFGTLSGHSSSWAVDINDHGGIVGTSWSGGKNPDLSSRIFRWEAGTLQDLGEGEPNGINDAGDIVGWTRESGPFVLQGNSRTFLSGGMDYFYRADQMINNSGTVAARFQEGLQQGAGVWESPYVESTSLGFPAACIEDERYNCDPPTPWAINDNGDVVGVIPVTYTYDSGDIVTYALAAIWHTGDYDNPVWMPRYPYQTLHRHARGVNNAGWVVGAMDLWQAVAWIPDPDGEYTSATVLPHFGSGSGIAYAVSEPDDNGAVRIVGEANDLAALWIVDHGGTITGPIDLGRPRGYNTAEARSINAEGWIVGRAAKNRSSIAVLWKPGEEPTDPEDPGGPEGTVTVAAIDYSTHGGRHSDNHLRVGISLKDDNGSAAVNVSVSIDLYHDGNFYGSRSGTTGSDGAVSFTFNNAPGGSYTTVVTDIEGDWDGITPENGFNK